MNRRPPLVVALLLASVAAGWRSPARAADATVGHTVETDRGVVVSVCPIASRVGRDVLRSGGNAVEAAVATAFALAVTWPEAGNIGGGGFMMVHAGAAGGSGGAAAADPVRFIDYRETAPAAVTPDTFAGRPSSHLLAGTPGTVRGLHLAFERYQSGKVAWRDLVAPAVRLAADGVEVDAALAASLNAGLRNSDPFPEFRRVYGKPDGSPWKPGDRLVLPELAETLRAIADRGPAGFYEGTVAGRIVDEMPRGGGLISADDLRAYEAKVREPVIGSQLGHTIYVPPPPSSGGVALLQILQMFEEFGIRRADRWAPTTNHLMVEAMRRAFADRAKYLGDPDFVDVPVARLVDPAYVRGLARSINPAKATRSGELTPWVDLDLTGDSGGQTTHFGVVDRDGMAVANTYTLEQSFGGKVVVRGAGFLLNNELGDFNPRPGLTARSGQIGTPPNEARPRKRPLSSMTPTIVARDGKVVLVTGSPGGRTIINTVAQVVLNRLAFGMTLRDAVDAPRLHHQWFPDGVRAEAAFGREHGAVLDALRAMGHQVDPRPADRQGDAHSIAIDSATGKRTGVADRRIGGAAAAE